MEPQEGQEGHLPEPRLMGVVEHRGAHHVLAA